MASVSQLTFRVYLPMQIRGVLLLLLLGFCFSIGADSFTMKAGVQFGLSFPFKFRSVQIVIFAVSSAGD